jgi:predicted ATP-dependent endonuclease of OLD family
MPVEQAEPPHFPLASIAVTRLFDAHDLTLRLDPAATVLTGENGSGKSTVLQAVSFVSRGDWFALSHLPLKSIKLTFADGAELRSELGDSSLTMSDEAGNQEVIDLRPDTDSLRDELNFVRYRMSVADSPAERNRFRRQFDQLRNRIRMRTSEEIVQAEWLKLACQRFRTKLISARRLEHALAADDTTVEEDGHISVVESFSTALAQRMTTTLSEYATESRQQERVLPSQIVRAMLKGAETSDQELAADVDRLRADVRQLADSLTRVGLFQEDVPEPQFDDYPRDNPSIMLAIREVYRVTLHRLQQLTELRSDLDLFARFLNARLSGKRIELNPRTGIDVVLSTDEIIRPSQLSSGEQQLLAVAYELLFGTDDHSVVLLDEPELSLHVAWLQGLLSALLEMGENRSLQFILATHSSNLLAGFQDRERSLDDVEA